MEDAIHGVTMQAMAEMMTKHNELRAQHGEPAFKPHFLQYLSAQGVDEATWANAWNAWMKRLDADKSGQLWAKFNQIQSQLSTQAHFGDVEDMSQEERGGLTLDMFAKLSAAMAQPGANHDEILQSNNVTMDVWKAGSAAWNEAMSQDTMHKITTQYGALYAKYNPAHQAAMAAAAGQIIANRDESSDVDDDDEEYTFEKAMEEVQSKKPSERWRAAHLLSQMCQTELEDDPARRSQAMAACVPQLIEALERFDKGSVSDAEAAASDLMELGQANDDVQGTIERALARAKDELVEFQAAFAPIKDKAVPERVYLQSHIQDYTSITESLQEILDEWSDHLETASDATSSSSAAAPSGGGAAAAAAPAAPTEAVGFIQKIMSFFR